MHKGILLDQLRTEFPHMPREEIIKLINTSLRLHYRRPVLSRLEQLLLEEDIRSNSNGSY